MLAWRARSRRMRGGRPIALALCAGTLWSASTAEAKPTAPSVVCKTYPTIPDCAGRIASCTLCHDALAPASWNDFGADLKSVLAPGVAFDDALRAALAEIEGEDSDADGVTNIAELTAGSLPGDPQSTDRPRAAHPMDAGIAVTPRDAGPFPVSDLGDIDLPFAFRRVRALYCGESPSFEDMEAFEQVAISEQAGRRRLHEVLEGCLQSDYWLKTALPRLADKRIKPQGSIGPDTQIRLGPLRVVLGDYHFDYRLWRYVMSGDRDMRELLTADYHVLEAPDGTLSLSREVIPKVDPMALGGGQPLQPQYRAGMLTTQWFLGLNTMFSAMPRTTAAQAYRAYLGADISAGEGLRPVDGEPTDVDNKGVDAAGCAGCHSTLDPLAYAFMRYEGLPSTNYEAPAAPRGAGTGGGELGGFPVAAQLGGDGGVAIPGLGRDGGLPGGITIPSGGFNFFSIGVYNPSRPKQRIRAWDDGVQQPVVLGKPVETLLEWAQVAAASDEFKRNLAEMFFVHAFGQKPQGEQLNELNAIWRALPEDGYSANRLIHRLIDTPSFGAP